MRVPSFVRGGFTFLGICGAIVTGVLGFPTAAGAQTNFRLVHTFPAIGPSHPVGRVIQATDGNFYGTTSTGGSGNGGTVFKLTPAGTLTILHAFTFGNSDGGNPQSGVIQATDGNLYGTTQSGGTFGQGTLFQISTSGAFTVLHSFSQPSEGQPFAALIQATDGNFYGTTQRGGSFGSGTIFKMTPAGVFTVLRSFNPSTDGNATQAALMQASDGNLYGTTPVGGPTFAGTVFKITTGGTFTVLHTFASPTDGGAPQAALIQATDGNLYGTTSFGTPAGGGTIFQITTGGTFTVLHQLNSGTDGSGSRASLIQASDGNLYGTTQFGGSLGAGTLFQSTTAGTVTVLHNFGGASDGTNPAAGVIQATDGNLWGTALNSTNGAGAVFKSTLAGTESLVATFFGNNEAALPRGTLVQQPDGNLYGITSTGGPANFGAVYKITPSGTLTILRQFSGPDGNANGGSENGLSRAADGNLYGTTQNGGANGGGTIFQISAAGAFTLLRSFNPSLDGGAPQAGVIQGTDGNLYGTTTNGGTSNFGTIYSTPLSGATLNVLRSFSPNDGTDGNNSFSRLVQANDGNFYGTSQNGGNLGQGAVFRITPAGVYTVLHEFNNDGLDGSNPIGGLIQASDGNLYGTTSNGGINGSGTIFRMTLGGVLTVIHDFANFEGSSPQTALIQGSDGSLYGTARFGGSRGFGTVFKITLGGIFTRLYSFIGDEDGANPQAGLVQGIDGNLYGTTSARGFQGTGTVFRLSAVAPSVPLDADGDGKADPVIYRPAAGTPGQFFAQLSVDNFGNTFGSGPFAFGSSLTDIPVVGDFDGDSRLDLVAFRRSTGQWFVSLSSTNNSFTTTYTWGRSGDIPVAGDYDGDGKADLAVYRPSTGQWFIAFSSTNYTSAVTRSWGQRGDLPVPGDYDGDGKTDLGVFRPSTGDWFIEFSTTHTGSQKNWGQRGDIPVPGDYDGDHRTDIAVFRPASGAWFVATSGSGYTALLTKNWGAATDIPVPADYDGDGKIDFAVWRPSTGQWFAALSSTTYTTSTSFVLGTSTDIPLYAVFAVNLAGVADTTRAGDFDADRTSDVAVFRPSTGEWFIKRSSAGFTGAVVLGVSTDIIVPGDYDGDGKTDVAVFRPSTGEWLITRTTTGVTATIVWGVNTDIPVPGDYDGDGKTDVAFYRPSTGEWKVLTSSSNFVTSVVYVLGFGSDKPVPGDYDGDGRTDPAVYRSGNGQWLMLLSSASYTQAATHTWGNSTDVPVPGDYDGDGVTDIAVYRPSTGQWFVLQSRTDDTTYVTYGPFGAAGDVAVPADYDGDGIMDIAVFRPSTGEWFLNRSSLGFTSISPWGAPTDIPLNRRQ